MRGKLKHLFCLYLTAACLLAQGTLRNEDIVRMVAEKTPAHVIVDAIRASPQHFILTPSCMTYLQRNGVGDDLIKTMAAKQNGRLSQPTVVPTAAPVAPVAAVAPRQKTDPVIIKHGAASSYKVRYDGGSVSSVKTGEDLKVMLDQAAIRFAHGGVDVASIPAAAVTEISYGQDVHRRVGAAIGVAVVSLGIGALLALTKSKKHFIGVTWDDGTNKGGLAFQASKGDYRGLLSGLEGVTGKKAVSAEPMSVKN
jgi:hypothetical protein